jgi:hypothetical protein
VNDGFLSGYLVFATPHERVAHLTSYGPRNRLPGRRKRFGRRPQGPPGSGTVPGRAAADGHRGPDRRRPPRQFEPGTQGSHSVATDAAGRLIEW